MRLRVALLAFLAPAAALAQVPEGGAPEGLAGIGGALTAPQEEASTLRVVLSGDWFDQQGFAGSNVELSRVGSSIGVGWVASPALRLAFQALASSSHGTEMVPQSIQALGDLSLAGLWLPVRRDRLRLGLHAGLTAFAGSTPFSSYADTASPFADLVVVSGGEHLRVSGNLGYVFDRSEALVPSQGDAVLSPAQRTAYGASDSGWGRGTLVVDDRLAGGRIDPWLGVSLRDWTGGKAAGTATTGTAGLRATLGGGDRALSLDAGVEARLGSNDPAAARPADPDWRARVGLSLSLPPPKPLPVPVVQRVEVPMPPPPPTTGEVTGTVRDARSGEPLSWVVVEVPGVTENPILTDSGGVYRLKGLPAGATRLHVQRPGYLATEAPVTVAAGSTATSDLTLEPNESKTAGIFTGDIHARDGTPVPAKLTFLLGRDSRSILADGTGGFSVTLAPGRYQIRVEASGYLPQAKTLEVSPGQTSYHFVLVPTQ